MQPILLIARRELKAYLTTMSGYVIVAFLLLLGGLFFNVFGIGGVDKRSSEVLNVYFYDMSGVVMGASVLLSMRLLAEERQLGTLALLYSSPISDTQIVVGKFLSALAFICLMLAASVYMPLLILVNGKISVGHMVAGYLGLVLLGSASVAIGIFGSALARSQVLAVIISGVMVVSMLVMWMLARVTERPFSDIFTALALHGQHFQPFQAGIVHLRDIVYYLAVTYVALFGATRVIEARRWK